MKKSLWIGIAMLVSICAGNAAFADTEATEIEAGTVITIDSVWDQGYTIDENGWLIFASPSTVKSSDDAWTLFSDESVDIELGPKQNADNSGVSIFRISW